MEPCLALLDRLDSSLCQVKVGMELFTAVGPQILTEIHKRGFEIFLDLKFHDIPNTVAGACRSAVEHGIWLVNVHAGGGVRMLEAAREVVPKDGATRLIAVTMLTSMTESDLRETGVDSAADAHVARLTDMTAACGLDGVVCSPLEAQQLRSRRCQTQGQCCWRSATCYDSGRGDQRWQQLSGYWQAHHAGS